MGTGASPVLGFSRADHVELMERTSLETFMDGHIRAFHALGVFRPKSSTTT